MELLSDGYISQRSNFSPPISTIQQTNETNMHNFSDQTNSPIVQMDNPNPFSNIPIKQENISVPSNSFFPGDFTQQQASSSSSTAASNDAPIPKGHSCEICHKVFPDRSLLSKHKIAHAEAKHICNTCGRAFVREDKLRRHFQSVHSGERPFVCEVCNKAFARKDKLQEHAKHHNKDITFPCNVCNEVFLMRSLLNRHLRMEHQIKQTAESSRNVSRSQEGTTKRNRTQQEVAVPKMATDDASSGIMAAAAAAASAVASNPSGFYQHPSWNAANILLYNRYQQSQQQTVQPGLDFWSGNNCYLYGQQYSAAGYQFPTIQYAAAMRQQQQSTQPAQPTASSGLPYTPAEAAAITARLLSPGNYLWPQSSQGFVFPQCNTASTNPASASLIPTANTYFPAPLTPAAVATSSVASTQVASKSLVTEAAQRPLQQQANFNSRVTAYFAQPAASAVASSSYQTAHYQAASLAGSIAIASSQQRTNDQVVPSDFAYTS